MGKGRYLLKRLVYIVFVFFIISILMFAIYNSTQYKQAVINIIGGPMANTVLLNVLTMIVVFAIAIPLGIVTAVRKNVLYHFHPDVRNL